MEPTEESVDTGDQSAPRGKAAEEERFWDTQARENCLPAIYSSDDVVDPSTREDAFEKAGEVDAHHLAWFVTETMTVLDLGCGIGRVMRSLAPSCRELVGVDVSAEMLEQARQYLEESSAGIRLVKTDGSSLAGVEDESIDFLYSLLCLIHVNKRSAFRYFREMRRVLRPGCLVRLQFQNILSEAGFGTFLRVLDSDYPLEFYTRPEVALQLRRAGLEPLTIREEGEFLQVVAIRGSARAWTDETASGIHVDLLECSGLVQSARPRGDAAGQVVCRIRSELETARTFMAVLTLAQSEGDYLHAEAPVVVPARAEFDLVLRWDGDLENAQVLRDGELLDRTVVKSEGLLRPGSVSVHAGILPSGFEWTSETQALFPNFFLSRSSSLA